jgi:ABC-type uncharacterized transport system fused permease/ATPase subunit
VEYAEEIALLRGSKKEAGLLSSSWHELRSTTGALARLNMASGMLDQYVVRYMGILAAYSAMLPRVKYESAIVTAVAGTAAATAAATDPTQYFLTCLHLLVDVGMAFKNLVAVPRLLETVHAHGRRLQDLKAALTADPALFTPTIATIACITATDLSVATPDGERQLIAKLNFSLTKGSRLLVRGPNGSGKSSLLRCLAGVLPSSAVSGKAAMPPQTECYFLPQRPYLVPGLTLREQLLYPGNASITTATEEKRLCDALRFAGLGELLLQGSAPLDATPSLDGLSGGERQRLGIARMLVAAPRYALLDECTSACAVDFETALFTRCQDDGITLVTVSHRPELAAHHTHHLTLDGAVEVGYVFGSL